MLFVDTETTGLPKNRNSNALESQGNWPDIVSVAWATVTDGIRQPTKYHLIKPDGWTIPEDSIKIHGITMDYAIEHGTSLTAALNELIQDLALVDTVVAHNMEFDKNILFNALKWRLNTNPWHSWPQQEICTMLKAEPELKLPSKFGKKFKSPTLTELYRATFGEEPTGLHNSQKDVEALMDIYKTRWDFD